MVESDCLGIAYRLLRMLRMNLFGAEGYKPFWVFVLN